MNDKDFYFLRFEKANFPRLDFFDNFKKPDGEDLIGKIVTITKFTFPFGWIVGIVQYINKYNTKSYLQMTKICSKSALNTVFIGLAYATTTYYSAKYRKEDDEINHIIGGIGASIATGTIYKSAQIGVTAAMMLPLMGYTYKINQKSNSNIRIKHYLMSTKERFNCSFTKNKNLTGNWTDVPNN